MNGQALKSTGLSDAGPAFIPLPGGETAIYNSSGALAGYRHADWLGSSRLTTTTSRSVSSSSAYAPFGEQYATYGTTDASFTGQNSDTISTLYDFTFREYSPSQGRWVSPDPAGIAAANPASPQSWNRYAYVMNSPLRNVDPNGLMCQTQEDGTFNLDSCIDPWYSAAYNEVTSGMPPTTPGAGPLCDSMGMCEVACPLATDGTNRCNPNVNTMLLETAAEDKWDITQWQKTANRESVTTTVEGLVGPETVTVFFDWSSYLSARGMSDAYAPNLPTLLPIIEQKVETNCRAAAAAISKYEQTHPGKAPTASLLLAMQTCAGAALP